MTLRLIFLALPAVLTVGVVAAPALAQIGDAKKCNPGYQDPAPNDAGVCYSLINSSSPSSCLQNDVSSFCFSLRDGVFLLGEGKGLQALARVSAAAQAAAQMRDDRLRRQALDEARGARAIVLATLGDSVGAQTLLEQPSFAKDDILALLKAAFYIRQNDLDKAALSFEAARRELPARWCNGLERTYESVKKGAAPGIDGPLKRDMAQWHYLPSYFSQIGDVNCVAKAVVQRPPLETAVRIDFDSGRSGWKNTPENRAALNRILDAIGRDEASRRRGVAWRVVGFTDQQCPPQRKKPEACRASNQLLSQQRAETVKARVLQELNNPDIVLTTMGAGMSSPVVDVGFDKPHPHNRRAVVLPSAVEAPAVVAEDCPWTVRIKGGALDGVTVQSNAPPLRVGRSAWYEIIYDPPKGKTWSYFSAIRELSDGAKENIASDGGEKSFEIRELTKAGGRLPLDQSKYYRVDSRQDTEAIVLSVAEAPISVSSFLNQYGAGKPIQVASIDGMKLYTAEDLLTPKTKGPTGRMSEELGRTLNVIPQNQPSPMAPSIAPPAPPQARVVPSPEPPSPQTALRSCRFMLSLL